MSQPVQVSRIRQIAVIVPQVDPIIERLHALFGVEPSLREELPQFDVLSKIVPIGDQFLELIKPLKPGTAQARFLDKRGPGLYMLILESDEGLTCKAKAEACGIPVVATEDRPTHTSVHLHPKAMANVLVAIDTSKVTGDWPAAGPHWQQHIRSEVATGIFAFSIAGWDADQMVAPYRKLFGMEVRPRTPGPDYRACRARVGHGGTYLDFLTPAGPDTAFARHLARFGPGPAAVEIQVRDLPTALDRARSAGVRLRDQRTDPGGRWATADLDPDDLHGLPLTLVQRSTDAARWAADH